VFVPGVKFGAQWRSEIQRATKPSVLAGFCSILLQAHGLAMFVDERDLAVGTKPIVRRAIGSICSLHSNSYRRRSEYASLTGFVGDREVSLNHAGVFIDIGDDRGDRVGLVDEHWRAKHGVDFLDG
jgi:hypothetical protein